SRQVTRALGAHLRQPVCQEYRKRGELLPDGQSLKKTIGYDANKHVKGRKRHIGVDTLGLLWVVIITSAGVQDRDGALLMLRLIQCLEATLKVIFADSAYRGALEK